MTKRTAGVPQMELQTIKNRFQSIYIDSSSCYPRPTPQNALCFTDAEVNGALANISPGKALPPGYAPAMSMFWRTAAPGIRSALCSQLAFPPASSPRHTACLWPDHQNSSDRYSRKQILADRIRERAEAYIRGTPQFAYISQRGNEDAIGRVCGHLHAARTAAALALPTTHQRKAGATPCVLAGVSPSALI